MKFRKKPVVIEAEQFTGSVSGAAADGIIAKHLNFGIPKADDDLSASAWDGKYWVQTLEGPLVVNQGDWLIRGVKGEVYPCKPDIFEMTYDAEA